jgi:hypothetical protein
MKITMKTKYKLVVRGAGNYSENSLLKLFCTVMKHRLEHLLKGEGWTD